MNFRTNLYKNATCFWNNMANVKVLQNAMHHERCYVLFLNIKNKIQIIDTDLQKLTNERNEWYCPTCLSNIFPYNLIEGENDFLATITDISCLTDKSLCYLSDKLFMPFELNDKDHSSALCDIDPDIHFYQEFNQGTVKCNYYLETKFNEEISEPKQSTDVLSLCHVNIRSARKNLGAFENYLNILKHEFTVIGLTETWLNDNDFDLYGLSGYKVIGRHRVNRTGGGVAVCVQDQVSFRDRPDLSCFTEDFETVFIEIEKGNQLNAKNVIIGVIYRPPNQDILSFNEKLNDIINKIRMENKICYLLGDYNINILNYSSHVHTAQFVDMMSSSGFLPLITRPTRVTATSATLIDRLFSLKNKEEFYHAVSTTNWDEIDRATDTQQAFDFFHNQLTELYNKHFPKVRIKKKYSNRKPWLSEGLKNSIRHKNKLYVKCKKVNSAFNEELYKTYKRKLQQLMKVAEKHYYHDLLVKYSNDMKKSWGIIKNIINKNQKPQTQSRFKIGDNLITSDKNIICNKFNDFFVNIGPTLAKSIPKVDKSPLSYMGNRLNESIYLEPVTEKEIKTLISALKDTATGFDDMNSLSLKISSEIVVKPLTNICNLSLTQGIFPSQLKIANVIPLYKSDDPMLFNNYRPVSVLCVLSKVFEKIMYNRVSTFLEIFKILHENQYGFRKKSSTHLALLSFVDKVIQAIEKGEYAIGVFLDFAKVFDTVDHDILLDKLDHYGFRGCALSWFKVTWVVEHNMLHMMEVNPTDKWLSVGYHEVQFWAHCLFWFTSMTFVLSAKIPHQYYLLMTPTCFLVVLTPLVSRIGSIMTWLL